MVRVWQQERLASPTVQTYLSFLRGLALWLGKPGLVHGPEHYGLVPAEYQRHEAAERDAQRYSRARAPEPDLRPRHRMARHAELTRRTSVKAYFCDPHSPWQRGSCENTNGLLRQYLPKSMDLSVHSQEDLDGIADSLNGRPRATLDWDCPLYFYEKMLALAHAQPASVQ